VRRPFVAKRDSGLVSKDQRQGSGPLETASRIWACAAQNASHTLRLGVFTLPVAVLLGPHKIFRVKVQPIGIPENIYRYVEDVATCFQSPSIEGLAHQLHSGTPFIPVHTV